MLYDSNGTAISPIWYDRGSAVVLVRYADGTERELPASSLTSPQGPAYAARLIRTVRVP